MTYNDNLAVQVVQVGNAQVNGSATALPVYIGTAASHYQIDLTRPLLAGNGEYGTPVAGNPAGAPVANTGPTNGPVGGLDQVIACDVTNAGIFVDLPTINLAVPPMQQPWRGRSITITSNGAGANTVTITPLSSGSGSTAPAIDGGSAGAANSALLPVSVKHSVTLIFDGLNWNVLNYR